jgi:hypothetical protein
VDEGKEPQNAVGAVAAAGVVVGRLMVVDVGDPATGVAVAVAEDCDGWPLWQPAVMTAVAVRMRNALVRFICYCNLSSVRNVHNGADVAHSERSGAIIHSNGESVRLEE